MPLFYHKYVNYVLAHSVNYVITLYTSPLPYEVSDVIFQMQNHTSTLMIAVRKASGIVRFWARVANDKNIKKRSQHITVTAFIDYCFV